MRRPMNSAAPASNSSGSRPGFAISAHSFPLGDDDRPETAVDVGIDCPQCLGGFLRACQVLLVCDDVIAENDAYLTLPARKEGIIPGAVDLRPPRLTGDRIARQTIQFERRIACDSPEGRLICDETVGPGAMDEAKERVVGGMTNSGVVSAVGDGRAIRIGEEPLDRLHGRLRSRAGLLPFQTIEREDVPRNMIITAYVGEQGRAGRRA